MYHSSTRLYYPGTLYHGIRYLYHLYHGGIKMYDGIPQYTIVQVNCSIWLQMDVLWYRYNVPWYTIMYHGTSFVPCLHHGNTRMYHGTFAIYHGSTSRYHGTVTLYHGIPLFTVVYHGCAMVVPWYFFHKGPHNTYHIKNLPRDSEGKCI